jgi:hypothetical protein
VQERVRDKLAKLERDHMHAMHALEATFEKRLRLQQSQMHTQIAARDDEQLHVQETMHRVHQACAGRARYFACSMDLRVAFSASLYHSSCTPIGTKVQIT